MGAMMNLMRDAVSIVSAILMYALVQPASAENAEKQLSVEWRVTQDQVDDVKGRVPLTEAQQYDARNPTLVGAVILVGAVVLPQVAQAIIDVYNKYKSGGVIIDTTKEPLMISTNNRIAPGFALIISKDGTQLIEVGGVKPLKLEDLIPVLEVAFKK